MSARQSASGAHVRTSQRQAEKVAQIAAQRVLQAAPDSTPAWVNEGAVRAVLGDLTDELKHCAGECGARLLGYDAWQSLEKPRRARLRELGVNKNSSFGRCWKCTEADAKKGERPIRYVGKKVSADLKAQIPQIWAGIQDAGGSLRVLGERLGVTAERARQLVKEMGLPHRDQRSAPREEFLEELHHLASFGLGAHEIAQKLGTNADSLVRRVDSLRERGLTTVSFPTYFRYYDKEGRDAA